jgi:hypothetical protein
MAANIHPELIEQLDRAGSGLVQAIVHLKHPDQADAQISPEETAKLADTILGRVARDVGHPAARSNVLRNLATMVVEADGDFLRSLSRQPEVAAVSPNRTAESPFIPPKGKRPVE